MKPRGWGRAVACTQLLYGNLYKAVRIRGLYIELSTECRSLPKQKQLTGEVQIIKRTD